jgi:altronate hydrolase
VAKGGTTNLVDVYEYAETVTARGFVFIGHAGLRSGVRDRAGGGRREHDRFTTGRGSAYGCAPSPSLKLSTNTALWDEAGGGHRLNCGEIADGNASVDEIGEQLFRLMLDTARGQEQERAARLRPERIRALVRGRGDVAGVRLTHPRGALTLLPGSS